MAIYKHGRGFELRTTKNKQVARAGLDPGLPDCKSNTLTTQPCCLLNCPSTTPSCSDITKKRLTLLGKTEDNTMLMYRSGNFIQFITQFNVVS